MYAGLLLSDLISVLMPFMRQVDAAIGCGGAHTDGFRLRPERL